MSMRHKEEESRRMEGSSTNEELGGITERTATFYLYHPCFLLEEVLGALFKCLGFDIGTKTKEHVVKPPSDLEEGPITEENTTRKEHESSQEVLITSVEQLESSTTTQSFEFIRNLVIRRGRRRSDLSSGSSPGIN